MAQLVLTQNATPTAPIAGQDALYVKADDRLYLTNSSGTEHCVDSSGAITPSSVVTGAVSASTLLTAGTYTATGIEIQKTGGATPIVMVSSNIQSAGSVNNYLSIDIQNQSAGASASSDFIATANNGTDTTQYIDMGVNGSGYSVGTWTINGANDGYLYTSTGNLAIGTATSGKNLVLFAGGTLLANGIVTVSSTGAAVTGTLSATGTITQNGGYVLSSVTNPAANPATGTPSATTFLRGDGSWQTPAGGGTVTSVSVTTANGVSGTVATNTSTPAITLTLGAITPSSVNGNTITTGTGVLTLGAAKTLTVSNSLTLAGTDATTMTFPTTSATIARTDAANTFTGHQTIEGVTSTGATGTGKFVFDGTPTLVTPVLGVATATSINKVALTAPATASTLTIADGKTLTASNTLILAGTDSTTMTFPATSATIARTDAANTFTGTQTFSGNMIKSANPAFLVYPSAALTNVTGDGTTYAIAWDTEVFDKGSNFASNTFTAPVTGVYQFNIQVSMTDIVAANLDAVVSLVTTARTYTMAFSPFLLKASASYGMATVCLPVLADMTATNTATVTVTIFGGTKICDISGSPYTYWSGFLVG